MRPYQRTRGPRWLSAEQFKRRNIVRVPIWLGQQASVPAGTTLNHGEQHLGFFRPACGQFIVSSFAGEQRPGAADAAAVEGRAILMLAVAVAVVAVPAGALRQLDTQQRLSHPNGVQTSRV